MENPEPPRGRGARWVRRIVVVLVVLVVIVGLAPLALSLPFVRTFVADQVSASLGRPVRIEAASAFWGKGIDAEGIVLESPPGFDGPLATSTSTWTCSPSSGDRCARRSG
jgi:hypothetical protein